MIVYQNGMKLRETKENELEFILRNENDIENKKYIKQWSIEQHKQALCNEDILHMIIEDENDIAVGYVIMVGLQNSAKYLTLFINDVASGLSKFLGVPPSMVAKLCGTLHIREQNFHAPFGGMYTGPGSGAYTGPGPSSLSMAR